VQYECCDWRKLAKEMIVLCADVEVAEMRVNSHSRGCRA
jgi:hypothetical protein